MTVFLPYCHSFCPLYNVYDAPCSYIWSFHLQDVPRESSKQLIWRKGEKFLKKNLSSIGNQPAKPKEMANPTLNHVEGSDKPSHCVFGRRKIESRCLSPMMMIWWWWLREKNVFSSSFGAKMMRNFNFKCVSFSVSRSRKLRLKRKMRFLLRRRRRRRYSTLNEPPSSFKSLNPQNDVGKDAAENNNKNTGSSQ